VIDVFTAQTAWSSSLSTRYLVHDVEASLKFYVETLGFTVMQKWGPAFAVIERQGLQLWISGPGTSAMKAMPDGRKPVPGGWNRIVLEVENLAALVEQLQKQNVTFRSEIVPGPGGKQVLIEDPSGNPLELFQSWR
jgi:catechol 2,3-dioxygenase-like lactoylglutathione lyase family enzyme